MCISNNNHLGQSYKVSFATNICLNWKSKSNVKYEQLKPSKQLTELTHFHHKHLCKLIGAPDIYCKSNCLDIIFIFWDAFTCFSVSGRAVSLSKTFCRTVQNSVEQCPGAGVPVSSLSFSTTDRSCPSKTLREIYSVTCGYSGHLFFSANPQFSFGQFATSVLDWCIPSARNYGVWGYLPLEGSSKWSWVKSWRSLISRLTRISIPCQKGSRDAILEPGLRNGPVDKRLVVGHAFNGHSQALPKAGTWVRPSSEISVLYGLVGRKKGRLWRSLFRLPKMMLGTRKDTSGGQGASFIAHSSLAFCLCIRYREWSGRLTDILVQRLQWCKHMAKLLNYLSGFQSSPMSRG